MMRSTLPHLNLLRYKTIGGIKEHLHSSSIFVSLIRTRMVSQSLRKLAPTALAVDSSPGEVFTSQAFVEGLMSQCLKMSLSVVTKNSVYCVRG